jgi:hypothetical protein
MNVELSRSVDDDRQKLTQTGLGRCQIVSHDTVAPCENLQASAKLRLRRAKHAILMVEDAMTIAFYGETPSMTPINRSLG